MSDQIEVSRVKGYESGITLLAQQRMSRLRDKVRVIAGAKDKIHFFDQIGKTDMVTKTGRHSATQIVEVEQFRRSFTHTFYSGAEHVDRNDLETVLNDPTTGIGRAQAAAKGRRIDQTLADAFFAVAKTGEDGGTSTSFPTSTHQVAHGSTGLNTAKVIEAKSILDEFENDMGERRFAATSSQQLNLNLLQDTEAKNSDYNTVKALVQGDINTWVGFDFSARLELLPLSGSTRSCPFWSQNSMVLGQRGDFARVTQESTNHFMWQVYHSFEVGATRADELGVVEVQCTEV